MTMTLKMSLGMTETARIKQLKLPAETISIEVQTYSDNLQSTVAKLVRRHLRDMHDVYVTDCMCPDCVSSATFGDDFDWATAGSKLHKRIKTYIFKKFQVQLADDFLRSIADLAATERNGISRVMDVTTEFTWKPGDFGDRRSCFFNQFRVARLKHLPKIGASAVRTFNDGAGDGRYWIFPLPVLSEKGREIPIYVAFNGYGALKDSEPLYYNSMLMAAEARWGKPFALTPVVLSMYEVFVNEDRRQRLLHPADLDVADFVRTIRGSNQWSEEPLRPYNYDIADFQVDISDRMYDRVGLPVPAWTKWADGRYCRNCEGWDYIKNLKFRNQRPYCAECFANYGWLRSEDVDPDDID